MSANTEPETNDAEMTFSRLRVLAFFLVFGLAVVIGQVVRYQVIEAHYLRQEAIAQRTWTEEIPATRGAILDARSHPLALDVYQWDISASPDLVSDPEETASALAGLLGQPVEEVYAKLTAPQKWVPLADHVEQSVGEAIAALDAPGIVCTPKPLRVYPEGDLFAHLLGIVNDMRIGFYGVEGFYHQTLQGKAGHRTVEKDPIGNPIPIPPVEEEPPQPGAQLILTVDRNIQHIAYEELRRALETYGAESGSVVVMDPRSGAILASVSLPSYDPNAFAKADMKLLQDPVVSSMWEPGSIFKVITWGAGLDTGTISPGTTFYDDGSLEVGGRVIRNWDRRGHGLVTMSDGLVQSLNTVAAFISTSTGKKPFYNYLRRFGMGQLTEVDLASEGPGMVKLPGDSNWFPSELGTNSFGQGIAVTPIQMIRAVAAIANDGMLMKPYVVRAFVVQDEEGGWRTVPVEPMAVRQAITRDTARTLTEMMVRVVEEGATEAQVPGYRIAGKTGTAQIPTPYGYHPSDTIASFVGFAPADDPRFIVLVKLDRPRTSPWGSRTAAPTFRAIARRLFVYMQIPPDDVRLGRSGGQP